MIGRVSALLLAGALALFSPACGYRWAVPGGPTGLALAPVVNATPEPRLGDLLRRSFLGEGELGDGGDRTLEVVAVGFREEVASLGGDGVPARERAVLELEWRVRGGDPPSPAVRGKGRETVTREYPWSADPAALDWVRESTLKLLARDGARAVLMKAAGAR